MRRTPNILKPILQLLINEYGHNEVYTALADLEREIHKEPLLPNKKSTAKHSSHANRHSILSEIQDNPLISEEKKLALLDLATQFKEKKFLPSASDARNFLEMNGVATRVIKSRTEAYRAVLESLAFFTEPQLEKLRTGNLHRGPAQLGSLSDAINEAGAALRKDQPANVSMRDPNSPEAIEEGPTRPAHLSAESEGEADHQTPQPPQETIRKNSSEESKKN